MSITLNDRICISRCRSRSRSRPFFSLSLCLSLSLSLSPFLPFSLSLSLSLSLARSLALSSTCSRKLYSLSTLSPTGRTPRVFPTLLQPELGTPEGLFGWRCPLVQASRGEGATNYSYGFLGVPGSQGFQTGLPVRAAFMARRST